jgi:homoserine O-succinyltransferase
MFPPTAIPIKLPANYSPNDNPAQPLRNRCRSHAFLLFASWINETYQTSPFDPALLGTG